MSSSSSAAAAAAKTASRCTPETARGTHEFEIVGYSLHRGLGRGKFIRSAAFAVGGLDWCIRYYPDGDFRDECRDYVSAFVELLTAQDNVRALYSLGLVDHATGLPSPASMAMPAKPMLFDGPKFARGEEKFIRRSELEAASPYLRHDRLVIHCDVTVIKDPLVVSTAAGVEIEVPPSDILANLGGLFEDKKEADVRFIVEGEIFRAHKIVLAMRSPVFKAELYGPMRNRRIIRGHSSIVVEDMRPAVFRGLLHFIYTDSLPLDGSEDNDEMVKELLVAADRYGMERMKLMCESIICKSLDVESVANTLALADQHHCIKLKDACIQFISSLIKTDDLIATQGYQDLKRECPFVFVDIWEEAIKSRKI
uniref:BTB domain-containing protein n=1 Tax=Leersia perrieri TaxID=77586 RepID=A0A0D9X5L1_9ORYZ